MSSSPNSSSSKALELPPGRAPFRDVPVVVDVVLGKGGMPVRQLVRLEPGVVLRLDSAAGANLVVRATGVPVALGEIVIIEDSVAARVTHVLTPSGEVASVSVSPVLAIETAGLADGELWRSLVAIAVVFGLLGALAWAARRGRLGFFTRQPSQVRVEATVPLGERRSLVVVAIEGRRLLLGLTPMQVSLVTELTQPSPGATEAGFGAARAFEQALGRAEATAQTAQPS